MKKIPIAGPSITAKEIEYVTDAVSHAWYDNANKYHHLFESAFADYIGVKYAISLPSCTSGIHLFFAALELKPGDEVIVPDATWIASTAPISYVGAKPVFVDVDPQTWCLSADAFEAAITPRTRAVLPVDLYGNMPDMERILAIAQAHDIAVLEDAAEAIGSEYKGQKAGSFGQAGVFSFHGSKTLTTGEGGMFVTNDEALYNRCLVLRDHGRQPGDKRLFWNTEVAYKYKMSSLQAALGLAQLERIDTLIEHKRQIFKWYQDSLKEVSGIQLNYEAEQTKNTYWMNTLILDPELQLTKEDLRDKLAEKGIDTRPFFYPLSGLPAYADLKKTMPDNPVSEHLGRYGINLPSSLSLDFETVNFVAEAVKSILQQA